MFLAHFIFPGLPKGLIILLLLHVFLISSSQHTVNAKISNSIQSAATASRPCTHFFVCYVIDDYDFPSLTTSIQNSILLTPGVFSKTLNDYLLTQRVTFEAAAVGYTRHDQVLQPTFFNEYATSSAIPSYSLLSISSSESLSQSTSKCVININNIANDYRSRSTATSVVFVSSKTASQLQPFASRIKTSSYVLSLYPTSKWSRRIGYKMTVLQPLGKYSTLKLSLPSSSIPKSLKRIIDRSLSTMCSSVITPTVNPSESASPTHMPIPTSSPTTSSSPRASASQSPWPITWPRVWPQPLQDAFDENFVEGSPISGPIDNVAFGKPIVNSIDDLPPFLYNSSLRFNSLLARYSLERVLFDEYVKETRGKGIKSNVTMTEYKKRAVVREDIPQIRYLNKEEMELYVGVRTDDITVHCNSNWCAAKILVWTDATADETIIDNAINKLRARQGFNSVFLDMDGIIVANPHGNKWVVTCPFNPDYQGNQP